MSESEKEEPREQDDVEAHGRHEEKPSGDDGFNRRRRRAAEGESSDEGDDVELHRR